MEQNNRQFQNQSSDSSSSENESQKYSHQKVLNMDKNQQKLPFIVEQIQNNLYTDKKEKKKSKLSQKMKEFKLKNKKKQSPSQDNIPQKEAKKIQFPEEFLDNLNYISLEQYQSATQDKMTTNTYKQAIKNSSHLFVNKIVLHLTTGCNILYSIFAAQAMAAKVYCVVSGHSRSQMQNIWMMQQIIKQNKYEDKIEVLCFKDFNAQIDIIIGEPMGFCMHYDGMIDRMIQARDLYLDKQNGLIFPDKLKFKCSLINDEHYYDKKIQYWNQIYGISMKSMKEWISHQPLVKVVDPTLMVSEIVKFLTFDLKTVRYQQIEESTVQFKIPIHNKCTVNGISIWFQLQFNQGDQIIQLKASPWQQNTKFTHVTLYTHKKLQFLQDGEKSTIVEAKMHGKKYPHQGYSIVQIKIGDHQHSYAFS